MQTKEQLEEYSLMCDCQEVQAKRPAGMRDLWLPTQGEIQDMIWRVTCDYRLCQDFYYWAARTRQADLPRIKGKSFEQLWLQFFMWREYEKVWTADLTWVNERSYAIRI